MEELATKERIGFFDRLFGGRARDDELEWEEDSSAPASKGIRVHDRRQYTITVRRHVMSFEDAALAADGLKRGEQQIINLASTEPMLREKVKDFLAGVNYAQDATWEELGENVYLLAPPGAQVECAPATPRIQATHN